jgi:hypothetical protein
MGTGAKEVRTGTGEGEEVEGTKAGYSREEDGV